LACISIRWRQRLPAYPETIRRRARPPMFAEWNAAFSF
jgi:hypothetical protein